MIAVRAAILALPLCLGLALAACDGGDSGQGAQQRAEPAFAPVMAAPPPAPPPAPMMESVTLTGARAPTASFGGAADADLSQPAPDGAPVAQEGMLLAYSYAVGFELPVRNVAALKDQHEAECRAAGPRSCLVLGGSVNGDGQNYMYGYLSLRAEPQWLETFRAGLAADANAAGGRVSSTSTSTEDLTRNIVDTEARLTAQRTLRDRLIVLLQRPSDEIDDLLAVERELARVQGEIDSATSQLAVMRARVDMSSLDLSYSSVTNPVSSGALRPVVDALRNFLSVLAGSLAGVITIIAAALPVVVILIPLIILTWKGFRRWRTRRRTVRAEG